MVEDVDDGDGSSGVGLGLDTGLLGDEGPELVGVDDRGPVLVLGKVEVSHTVLSEVTRVVDIHVDTVVMLTTSKTTTTGMLAVLTDTSVTGGYVTALLSVLGEVARLYMRLNVEELQVWELNIYISTTIEFRTGCRVGS